MFKKKIKLATKKRNDADKKVHGNDENKTLITAE